MPEDHKNKRSPEDDKQHILGSVCERSAEGTGVKCDDGLGGTEMPHISLVLPPGGVQPT